MSALPPPSPPGPHAPRRSAGPTLVSVSLRAAIGATLVGVVFIALQVSRPGPRARTEAEIAAAESVEARPAAVTTTAAERNPRLVPFHGLLESVADYEDVAQNRAYATLADHTRRLTDEEAARVLRPELGYQELVKTPHLLRGELIRADGLLIKLEPVRLVPGAGPPGVEDAWRGWLMEPGGDECFVFDLVGEPADLSKRELVRVEGTFLKVLRYENKRGEPRDAPFLVARRAWALTEEEIERPFRYDYVAVALLGLIAAFILVQRKRASHETTLLEAKRAELERKLKKKQTGGE